MRRLQQLVDPRDLLAQRQVLLQVHGRRSARFGIVRTDKRVRVLQELDPARDGGHGGGSREPLTERAAARASCTEET